MRVGIAAVVKHEARYLKEWIAYHQAIGVTDFTGNDFSGGGFSEMMGYGVRTDHGNGIVLKANQFTYCTVAAHVDSSGSVFFTNNMAIGCSEGFVRAGTENHADISHNHFACDIGGVRIDAGNHCQIAHNFILTQSGMTEGDFTGIQIASLYNTVVGNEVLKSGVSKTVHGAVLTATATNNIVSMNRFNGATDGLTVASGAVQNVAIQNFGVGVSKANMFLNSGGTSNRYIYSDSSAFYQHAPSHQFESSIGTLAIIDAIDATNANYIKLRGRQSGQPPQVAADGSDTNVDLRFAPKGTGLNRFTNAVIPHVDDQAALGSTSFRWADLFLASGGAINWNNGDVTVTHSSNGLAFAGAANGYTFDAGISTASVTAAALAAVGNAINTTGKTVGKMVWDTTNNRIMVASGTAAASPWYVADGSASVTPA